MVLVVLLGVEPGRRRLLRHRRFAASARPPRSPVGFLPEPNQRLAELRPQGVVGVELGTRLRERGRGDDAADLGGGGVVRVGVDGFGSPMARANIMM